jgi:hypothetical protein
MAKTHALVDRIRALAELEPNWDSYGAAPPTAVAIDMAVRMVQWYIRPPAAGHLSAVPTVTGGVEIVGIDVDGDEWSIEFDSGGWIVVPDLFANDER